MDEPRQNEAGKVYPLPKIQAALTTALRLTRSPKGGTLWEDLPPSQKRRNMEYMRVLLEEPEFGIDGGFFKADEVVAMLVMGALWVWVTRVKGDGVQAMIERMTRMEGNE